MFSDNICTNIFNTATDITTLIDTKDEYRQLSQGNLSETFTLMAILQLEEH